jgi:hypothetical protein
VNWRELHGVADRPRKRCPICGVESTGGRACGYHVGQRPEHVAAVRNRRHAVLLRQVLIEAIDEARA